MSKKTWTPEQLTEEFANLPSSERANLQKILDWAISNKKFIPSKDEASAFGIAGKYGNKVFWVYGNGDIRIFMESHKYANNAKDRDEMLRKLKSLKFSMGNLETGKFKSSIVASRKVTELSDQELNILLGIFGQYCAGWEDITKKFIPWTPILLTKFFNHLSEGKGKNLQKILDWAVANKRLSQTESIMPAFGIVGNNNKLIFNFIATGPIYVVVSKDTFPRGISQRNQLVKRLKEINFFNDDYDPETAFVGNTALKYPWQLSDSEVDVLLEIFEEFCL